MFICLLVFPILSRKPSSVEGHYQSDKMKTILYFFWLGSTSVNWDFMAK